MKTVASFKVLVAKEMRGLYFQTMADNVKNNVPQKKITKGQEQKHSNRFNIFLKSFVDDIKGEHQKFYDIISADAWSRWRSKHGTFSKEFPQCHKQGSKEFSERHKQINKGFNATLSYKLKNAVFISFFI